MADQGYLINGQAPAAHIWCRPAAAFATRLGSGEEPSVPFKCMAGQLLLALPEVGGWSPRCAARGA